MKNLLLIPLAFLLLSCEQRKTGPLAQLQVFNDDFSHVVQLKHTPRRIVSLAPSITETLFELGLDSAIVGVTDFCDVPDAARTKPKVGGMLNPNIERIVELKSDLVLMSASGNMQTDYQKLVNLGIPVFVSNPRTMDGVLKAIRDLGALTDRNEAADALVRRIEYQRTEVVSRIKKEPTRVVLLLLSLNPVITAGEGTFLDELITMAGGENLGRGARTAYPVLSREEIFRRRPEVIIATNDIVKSEDAILAAYPEWSTLPAVQHKRIAIVDASLVSRPGPRIAEGLTALAAAIHDRR